MRSRLTIQDGMIAAGALLLMGSIVGLYADTVAARGVENEPAPAVIRIVTPTLPPPPTYAPVISAPTLPPLTPGADSGAFLVPLPAEGQPAAGEESQIPVQAVTPPVEVPPPQVVPPAVGTTAPAPTPVPLIPNRIVIPRLEVDAPVYAASYALVEVEGRTYQQWQAPTEYAAGWQFTSAALRLPGNTVINGHHNVYGQVFARLHELVEGDVIQVYAGDQGVAYEVSNAMILAEEGQPLAARLENASWLQASTDERLTLVTCWPQWDNTHRVIIVARPVGDISIN